MVEAKVQSTHIRKCRVTSLCHLAPGQVQVNQQSVESQISELYSTTTGIQEAKLRILGQDNGVSAQVGVSLTLTGTRASEVAEVFIIMLRTLAPAVTNICRVKTDRGSMTAVKTRARGILTLTFILTTRTVIHAVTAYIHGQAVAVTWQTETLLQHTVTITWKTETLLQHTVTIT